MDWRCERVGDLINVSFKDQLLGQYVLIKKPYCDKCATPETDTASCQRLHQLDWFDGVRTVGIYYQKHLNKGEMLTDHILQSSNPLYEEPLGKSMGIVAREIFPELLKADGLVPIPLHAEETKKEDSTNRYC